MARRIRTTLTVVIAVLFFCPVVPVGTAEQQVEAAPAEAGFLAEAQRSIAEREYEATDAGEGLQAPNRAVGVRTYFEGWGARVVDRDNSAELLQLRTTSIGRGEMQPVAQGKVVSNGARVEVRRPGLVEWYENSERGLEQGWTLSQRPDGDGPLSIEVDFGGAVASVEGDRAMVGQLEYGGLAATDANGAELAVRMVTGDAGRVRIVVEDAGATYPITVDPVLTQPAFATLMGDQTSAAMGYSVAGAGDVNNDGYDDVIVGAYLYDSGQSVEGAAFVFLGGPNGIASGGPAAANTRLESNQAGAQMGYSVAGAGDINNDGFDDVIVGALAYDSGQADEGAAFVFLGGPSGIANGNPGTAATVLQSNQVNADLGYSVAGAGDVNDDGFADVIVGAIFYDSGQTDEGAAFVFLGSPSGIPNGSPASANAFLQGDQATSRFGASVAGAGDTNGDGYADVIIGARLYDLGQNDEGAAFVYLGGSAGITPPASATLQSNEAGALMGNSVAGAGDTNNDGFDDVIVGANGHDIGDPGLDQGAAYVFRGGPAGVGNQVGGSLNFLGVLQTGASFGYCVAGAGDVNGDGYDDVVVGAYLYDGGQSDEGGALLFLSGPDGVPLGFAEDRPTTWLQSDQAGAAFGLSVAGLGDVNGDGYDDVGAGAYTYDSGQSDEGAAFVYLGSRDGLNGFPRATSSMESNQANARMGYSVAGAGDVNNDGYDDIIVGSPNYDSGQSDEGAAFVFHGGPGGIANPSSADAILQSDQAGASLGLSVAGAGDTNGDGYDDVIVGAPFYDSSTADDGVAFVFFGGPGGVNNGGPSDADAILQSNQAGAQLGTSVAGAGDVNNDGYDDIVVGAFLFDSGQSSEGAAFVFHGGPGGVGNGNPANADAILQSDQSNALLGFSVAGAGDVNGDGYDDVIVGAYQYDAGQIDEGAAFVFHGGPTGVGNGNALNADATLQSDQADALMGTGVAGAGDVNNDGYDDIIVGAYQYVAGQAFEGAAFVFLGGPGGVGNGNPANADTVLQSDQVNGGLGLSVAGAGDVNGDGYADVVAGTFYGTDFESSSALVFLGGITGVPNGTPHSAAATLGPFYNQSDFPVSAAGAGDTNGDGLDDIIVGSSGYSHGFQTGEGGAFVFNLQRPPVANAGADTPGIYVSSSGAWFLRNANAPGTADVVFTFGAGGGGFVALRGDWDGDGDDTPGLYAPATGAFFLRNTNAPGAADIVFTFGAGGAGYVPLVGDWDGNGTDTIGLYQPSNGFFFLRNANAGGAADLTYGFGPAGAGWKPLSGDWDGNGSDTIGLYAPASGFFFLRNQHGAGAADVTFGFGAAGSGWTPLSGDFDGNGTDTIGLYNPANGFFFLRNQNAPGAADSVFGYGPANVTPLIGDWDGN